MYILQWPKERVPEEWMREKRELERRMRELQIAMDDEKRVSRLKKIDISELPSTWCDLLSTK